MGEKCCGDAKKDEKKPEVKKEDKKCCGDKK